MQEQDLYRKIKHNDPSSFRELFEVFHPIVFNLCFRMLGNREEGEDATQEVFVNIFKSLDKFRSESKFSTWIYRITINHCLNIQRRKKYIKWLSLDFILDTDEYKNLSHLESKANRPDILLEKREMESIIQTSINSLPKNQRIALILNRYEDLSYKEIAEIMKCSVSSVESRIFRAKQNLYKKLKPLLNNL